MYQLVLQGSHPLVSDPKNLIHAALLYLHRYSKTPLRTVKRAWQTCRQWLKRLKGLLNNRQSRLTKWFTNRLIVCRIDAALPGWEFGVAAAVGVALFTLNLNLWFLVVVSATREVRPNGLGTLWEGDCGKFDKINKVLHAIINVLSTVRLLPHLLYGNVHTDFPCPDTYSSVQLLYAVARFAYKNGYRCSPQETPMGRCWHIQFSQCVEGSHRLVTDSAVGSPSSWIRAAPLIVSS